MMTKRGKGKGIKGVVAKHAEETIGVPFTTRELVLHGLKAQPQNSDDVPHVNLHFYYPKYQCFSEWEEHELRAFSDFCCRIRHLTWNEIYKTGGSVGHKAGFAYTKHDNIDVLPNNPDLQSLSPDLTWFELRVTGEARVHGFRSKAAFFLVVKIIQKSPPGTPAGAPPASAHDDTAGFYLSDSIH